MIRLATKDDINEVTRVHARCFKDSYSSQLANLQGVMGGGNLLTSFYEEYLNDAPELFHVACDEDGRIVGFCMGYYMDNDVQMQRFLHKNRFPIIWKTILLLILANRQAWHKVLSQIKHKPNVSDWKIINTKYEHIKDNKRGDLLSVCVLPEFRGKGCAQQLMDSFLAAMKHSGREICLLSVDVNNATARRYYERNGFELYRIRGCDGLTYHKTVDLKWH